MNLETGKMVLTGNKAAAYGFALAGLDVFGGYPITPSTEITEEMAKLASEGKINTTYVNTDSELASAALGIGVSTHGGRYGTATSSQGLALMMGELGNWLYTSELPVVIANVNRSLGSPWSIHPDHTDSLLFRDFFMPQIYCATVQECLDMILWAYRLSEDPEVSLPVLVCLDGFMLSHTAETVTVPNKELIAKFLPPRFSRKNYTLPSLGSKTVSLGSPQDWQVQLARKKQLVRAMESAKLKIPEIAADWKEIFGQNYGNGFLRVSGYAHARTVIISMGAIMGTVEKAVKSLPKEDVKVVSIRCFRPFPNEELRNAIGNASKVIVVDRDILPNGQGAIAEELRLNSGACGYNGADIHSFVGGFGGQNLSEKDFLNIITSVENERGPFKKTYWLGGKA